MQWKLGVTLYLVEKTSGRQKFWGHVVIACYGETALRMYGNLRCDARQNVKIVVGIIDVTNQVDRNHKEADAVDCE